MFCVPIIICIKSLFLVSALVFVSIPISIEFTFKILFLSFYCAICIFLEFTWKFLPLLFKFFQVFVYSLNALNILTLFKFLFEFCLFGLI